MHACVANRIVSLCVAYKDDTVGFVNEDREEW